MFHIIVELSRFIIHLCIVWSYILPFVILAILVKNRLNQSSDVYEDWYHKLKLWWAKRTVKQYQRKCAEILKKDLQEDAELPKKLTTFKDNDSQIIYGTDQEGNMLFIKMTMRENRLVEAVLQMRLADGTIYELPEHPAILICSISERKWHTTDLEISIVEEFKILRISYSGFLKSVLKDEVHGIRFSFIWSAACRPRYYPYESNAGFLADTVAFAQWRDNEWTSILETEFGYDQYGMLIGQIERTDIPERPLRTVRMTSCRNRFWGKSHIKLLDANLQIFASTDNGMSFLIGEKSFHKKHKNLHYGSVIFPNRRTSNIEESSLSLTEFTRCEFIPGIYSFTFKAEETLFNCKAFTHRHSASTIINDEIKGWKYKIIKLDLIINDTQATGYLILGEKHKGKGRKLPPFLKTPIKYILEPEKRFVAFLEDRESRCESLVGKLGSSCALLSTLKSSKLFEVPKGVVILAPAFSHQVDHNPELKEALQELKDIGRRRRQMQSPKGSLFRASQRVIETLKNATLQKDILEDVLKELPRVGNFLLRLSYVDVDNLSYHIGKTPIYCRIEEVPRKILECYAEAFEYDWIKSRRYCGPLVPQMAIVLQEIPPVDVSGLLMTMDVATGHKGEMIIKAYYGQSLSQEPDTYVIGRDYKNRLVLSSEEESPEEKGKGKGTFCLSSYKALELASIGVELTKIFGTPMYINWFISEGKISVLSHYPIVRNSWSKFDLTHELDMAIMSKDEKISFTKFDRFFNGAMSVLTQSIYLQGLDEGLQKEREEDPIFNTSFRKMFTSVGHRIGFNETQYKYQLQDAYKDHYMVNHLDGGDAEHMEAIAKGGLLTKNPLYLLVKRIQNYYKFKTLMGEANRISWSIKLAPIEDPKSGYEEINRNIEKFTQLAKIHLKVSPMKFVNLPTLLVPDNKFEEIIVPVSVKRVTQEMFERFEQMRKILQKKRMVNVFCKVDIEDAEEWLQNNCSLVSAGLERFMSDFGHRGFKEMDMSSVPWAFNQTILIKALQLHLQLSEQRVEKMLGQDGFNFLNKIFNKTPYEVTKSSLASAVHKLRLSYLNLAECLVSEGKLPNQRLIFHLTHTEIRELIKRRNTSLLQKALRRNELFDHWNSTEIKNISLDTKPLEEVDDFSQEDIKVLGTTVYTGTITGRVCVINKMEDLYNLNFGDIVLTKYTDFGWSIFLQSISGIVIESHERYAEGPILAEHYNIPCLVGVERVTEYFQTGDNVLLSMETTSSNLGSIIKI